MTCLLVVSTSFSFHPGLLFQTEPFTLINSFFIGIKKYFRRVFKKYFSMKVLMVIYVLIGVKIFRKIEDDLR